MSLQKQWEGEREREKQENVSINVCASSTSFEPLLSPLEAVRHNELQKVCWPHSSHIKCTKNMGFVRSRKSVKSYRWHHWKFIIIIALPCHWNCDQWCLNVKANNVQKKNMTSNVISIFMAFSKLYAISV